MNTTQPRQACIIVSARKGSVRAAASLIRRALRAVGLTVHRGHYVSQAEIKTCGTIDSRFQIEMTDTQATEFQAEVYRLSIAEGWTLPPIDFYHD